MKSPTQDPHLQGLKDSPPGTPAERKAMEKIEAQLGDHEIKARKVNDGETAAQGIVSTGWFESKGD